MTPDHKSPSAAEHRMECMELWGGSSDADTTVSMTGLRGELFSRSFGEGGSGGDVYYFSSCASGRISRVLLADVTGHGEAVAQTAIALRSLMRDNVNVIGQSRLVETLNEEFGRIARAGGFATAVAVTHFSPTRTMSVTVAGHPPPIIYRQESQQWELLNLASSIPPSNHQDLPLGVMDESAYTATSFTMTPGDRILLYTDAFSESRNASGEMLHPAGLRNLLDALATDDVPVTLHNLIEDLRRQSPRNLTDDDATAVLLEPTGQRISLKQNLLAPWKMARGVVEKASQGAIAHTTR